MLKNLELKRSLIICLLSYSQLILKWRITHLDTHVNSLKEVIPFIWRMITDPWLFSGLVAAGLVLPLWLICLSKFNLSYAYPFLSTTFILVILGSFLFLGETYSAKLIIGQALIFIGVILVTLSQN